MWPQRLAAFSFVTRMSDLRLVDDWFKRLSAVVQIDWQYRRTAGEPEPDGRPVSTRTTRA